MRTSLVLYGVLVAAVVVERLAELVLSNGHARALLSRGGVERGASHYPPMVALHTGLLVACVAEPWFASRAFIPVVGLPMLTIVAAAQSIRWWAIASLGVHWSTRVIVLPGARRVCSGPYRWLRHPNYAAVVAEGIALPLVHSASITAIIFTALNAVILTLRVRVENAALATMRSA